MEITGTIKVINSEQVISEKFKKREFVITESDTKFPNVLMLELTQDKTELIGQYKVGDTITVAYNLRGREFEHATKGMMYFTSLNAWKIAKAGATQPQESLASSDAPDDLPF